MCGCKEKIQLGFNAIDAYIINDQSNGAFEKVVFSVNSLMVGTQYKTNGYELPTACDIDPETGKKIMKVKIKFATDTSGDNGFYPLDKMLNHQVVITESQFDTLNTDENTKIIFVPELDGEPVTHVDNGECIISCFCKTNGYRWDCYCFIHCRDGKGGFNSYQKHIVLQ